jgi:hypothetical protein
MSYSKQGPCQANIHARSVASRPAARRRAVSIRDLARFSVAGRQHLLETRAQREFRCNRLDLDLDAIGGQSATGPSGNARYDIYVRLAEAYRDSAQSIRPLIVQSPNGAWVRLGDVASSSSPVKTPS